MKCIALAMFEAGALSSVCLLHDRAGLYGSVLCKAKFYYGTGNAKPQSISS